MAIPSDQKQVVSFEELLMSQVVQQEALTRLLVVKGVFTKGVFGDAEGGEPGNAREDGGLVWHTKRENLLKPDTSIL
jgi:hypothetical protein